MCCPAAKANPKDDVVGEADTKPTVPDALLSMLAASSDTNPSSNTATVCRRRRVAVWRRSRGRPLALPPHGAREEFLTAAWAALAGTARDPPPRALGEATLAAPALPGDGARGEDQVRRRATGLAANSG